MVVQRIEKQINNHRIMIVYTDQLTYIAVEKERILVC